jgi:chromosome segregation ATPase
MTVGLSREQAQAAVAAASADRDTIQANLLELDGSFGKRLLAGATLTGRSREAWAQASAGLAALWETFTVYSAVIDRAAGFLAAPGRISPARLEEASGLLTGPSVRLTRAVATLGQRELTSAGQTSLTLAAAVQQMRRSFREVAAILTAAETVWNEVSDGIRQVSTDIETANRQLQGADEADLTSALAQAQTSVRELRELLNADPLALWIGGRVDSSRLDRLKQQASATAAQVSGFARARDEAGQRLAEAASAVAAAQQAWQDATVARERAAVRVCVPDGSLLPDVGGLAARVEALRAMQAAGRWVRVASELDVIGTQVAAATRQCREAEQTAAGLVEQRNELRGLLDAYRAKAAGTGGAENIELDHRYQQAKELLWTAPCDLAAAGAAVTSYQQAVLQLRRSGDRP